MKTLLGNKIVFTAFLAIFSIYSVSAARFARYNRAGYDPVRPKKIIVMSDDNCNGFAWRIKDMGNVVVLNGTIGASLTGSGNYMPKAFNHEIDFSTLTTEGTYAVEIDNVSTFTIKIQCRPYQFLLSQVLRTIRVRRSGSADALDHAISHLGDASCRTYDRNGTNNGSWSASADGKRVDMVGGFYDAGDYIKFTLTNAYLTYFMLRSYETAPNLFDGVKLYSTTALDDLLDESKWGLDFLMKTMPDANEFIIQTGGSADHNQWPPRLPENDALDGNRECYSAFSRTQMGLTAAALALGSKIFAAKGYATEATNYRNKAIQIYTAAKASTTANAWWQGGGEVFYADNNFNDNMELAAIELYLLTGTASYLTDAQNYGNAAAAAGWSAWSDLNLTAHARLMPYYAGIQTYITSDLNTFQSNSNITNNRWKLPHNSVWGSLYSQFSVAHGALQYQMAGGPATYRNIAYDVMDYTMGRNPWGLGFIATQSISGTITSSYATIYKLQPSKFPHGEIAEGPAPAADHASNTTYFSPAHNPGLWHSQFNTSLFTFFEQPGDYVCMETTICGLADGLFFLTLASKEFCTAPLPVKIIDFSGKQTGNEIQLNWSVSKEDNVERYIIEMSTDGNTFTEEGQLNPSSEKVFPKNYQWTKSPVQNQVYYFRLKTLDKDGSFQYSKVISVRPNKEEGFILFPNPCMDQLNIYLTQNMQHTSIMIYDHQGCNTLNAQYPENIDRMVIDTGTLEEGIYYCKLVEGNGMVYEKKFIKQR